MNLVERFLSVKVGNLIPCYGLEKLYARFLVNNNAYSLPYHNLYHANCMIMNVAEGARESRGFSDLKADRPLVAAAMFHDFNHSGGRFSDDVNIYVAVQGLIEQNKGVLSSTELEETVDILKITKYPFSSDPKTLAQKIIRDADLMQVYEPSLRQVVKQYRGLKREIEVARGRTYTNAEYADGQLAWWNANVVWHTTWAQQKAEQLDWENLKHRLHEKLSK